ncbi:MAG TPA: methyltransferase domain-containing protein [Kofleriaceae bacterium]
MTAFADHFSELAARYAQYRPHYPPALVDALAGASPARGVAWDIGCGNGQLSVALAARFDRVIATDPARAQLDHAERHPRVEYRCEPAEASSLPDAGVDLAVAAQAAHWFDWPRFVPEVGRVVRPGGLIALVTYFNAELDGEAGALLAGFYADIVPHWPGGRTHVNNRYRDLTFPWPAVEPPAIALTARWTRDELFGYVTTWSATARLVAAGGGARLERLGRELAERWPGNEPRENRWPLTIKLTRR